MSYIKLICPNPKCESKQKKMRIVRYSDEPEKTVTRFGRDDVWFLNLEDETGGLCGYCMCPGNVVGTSAVAFSSGFWLKGESRNKMLKSRARKSLRTADSIEERVNRIRHEEREMNKKIGM